MFPTVTWSCKFNKSWRKSSFQITMQIREKMVDYKQPYHFISLKKKNITVEEIHWHSFFYKKIFKWTMICATFGHKKLTMIWLTCKRNLKNTICFKIYWILKNQKSKGILIKLYSVHFHIHTYVNTLRIYPYTCTMIYTFCLLLRKNEKCIKIILVEKGSYSWLLLSNGAFDSAKRG